MERHFALPVAIAAAIHAGLLFGFRTSSAARHPDPEHRTTREHFELPPVVQLQTRDDETTPDSSAAKGSSEIERPTLPDPPAIERPDGPVMAAPPPRPTSATPGIKFDLSPPGLINGSENGAGIIRRLAGIRDLDNPPRARLQASPLYPFEAKRTGREGMVTVEFTVDEGGVVLEPRVVSSTDRIFDEATLRAVAKWRFEPGRRSGRIVRFRMALPVVFNLSLD